MKLKSGARKPRISYSIIYQGNPNRRYTQLERVTAEVSRYKSEATIHIDEKPLYGGKHENPSIPYCLTDTFVCQQLVSVLKKSFP